MRNKLQYKGGDPRALLEELRQELNHEKDLNANLRIQLQKTQESNSGSKEVVNLKGKIRSLEGQLKQKEAALEMSSKSFHIKEKEDLQRKIEGLEKSLEILNQNAASFCGYECLKLKEDGGNLDAEIGEEAKT
ncbi:hypothetical protein POM88_052487 [Heracleum sosnowskyi]|uniref:Uncharacterized protein n=1 Tax=Heracleum sosnowskyi TaxID=360622 RepID=A0AAD8GS36_9APIA|nr:hypothetical protein POM88_052487 [Heracleum sosnowskyi]